PAGLLVFERSGLRLLNHHCFAAAADLHSLWVTGDTAYVVSTGTDEIIAAQMSGPEIIDEMVFWRPDPAGKRADRHHLNAIYGWRGEFFVSGFGPAAGEQWTTAQDGFVANISRGYTLASGIYQPHSVIAVGESLAYCESPKGAVSLLGRGRVRGLPGYARGLCRNGATLFVGTSAARRRSRSTGVLNDADNLEAHSGTCAVTQV